jgi:predicted hydrocarbon binding protein
MIGLLPGVLRTRGAMRAAGTLVRSTYPGSRAIVKVRRGTASVDLRGSLFCEVREATPGPLCAFYAAAIARVLSQFALDADVRVHECRAASRGRGCLLAVTVHKAGRREPAAAA